jgi:hypothetical protein
LRKLYLDLSGNSDLAKDSCIAINRIAKSGRFEVTRIVDELTKLNHKSIFWLLSPFATKNPYASSFALQCARIQLFIELISTNQDSHFDVRVDSRAMRKLLNRISEKKKVSASIRISYSILIKRDFLNPIKQLLSSLYHQVFQALVFKIFLRGKERSECTHKMIVISTFLYKDSFSSGNFKDKHFLNLKDHISLADRSFIRYLPTFYKIKNYFNTIKDIKGSLSEMIFKEYFLKFSDYLYLFKCFKRSERIKLPKEVKLNGYCISELVEEESSRLRFKASTIEALLKYRSILRMSEKGIRFDKAILWYEGHDIDRAIVLGLRKNNPEVEILGYVGFAPHAHYLSIYPTQQELDLEIVPAKIGVIGSGYASVLKQFCQSLSVEVAPALRYQYPEDFADNNNDKDAVIVLIALPIIKRTALNIIDRVNELVSKFPLSKELGKKIIFYIKSHPSGENFKSYRFNILDNNIKICFSDAHFVSLANKAQVVVSVASSASVEALAYGCFVIVLADLRGVTQETIPDEVSADFWKIVYSSTDFHDALVSFMKEKSKALENATKIKELYFSKQDTSNNFFG